MDFRELPQGLQVAGQKYLRQLRALGLHPEALFWAYAAGESEYQLWMLWSGVERFGPLQLTEHLFRAFRAAALPQEINPFSVHIASPQSFMGKLFHLSMSHVITQPNSVEKYWRSVTDGPEGEIEYKGSRDWIYVYEGKTRKRSDVARDWKRFSQRVSKLAA
ncbi:hypothetical protein [Paracoccus aerius]|uniref:Uncharacterized protein n=1 Tax=Paracoccus aerius TaxID=1915382 RepID=A0ABS1S4G2_9RHOB|nr:hypothetical protein [Paracoccus aerius]MBL3673596.1 hypothetical protein [Paracoccus aerius]GHG36090.1 hypothetical protein GCM10017322_38670 [Paracoccus aerius]